MNDESRAAPLNEQKSRPSDGESHDSAKPPPTPPSEPEAADCCGEGCIHCVFDVYDEALRRYRSALTILQAAQVEQGGRA